MERLKGAKLSKEHRSKIQESQRRRRDREFEKQKRLVRALLKKNGPMTKRELRKDFSNVTIRWILSRYPETFKKAKICLSTGGGGRGSYKYTSYELFDGLSSAHIGEIMWLKGDERIIEFVGSRIMKPKTQGEVGSIRQHLNRIFGKELARKLVEATGYKYHKKYKS